MRQRGKKERDPVQLINILQHYGRDDYGSLFLYFPKPCRRIDEEARDWLATLKAMGSARRRWITSADQVALLLEHTHPHLFKPFPVCFEVYRLNQACLRKMFAKL